MTGRQVTLYWRICWTILSPLFMIIVFVHSMIAMKPLRYGHSEYPIEYLIAGWSLLIISAMIAPLWCIYVVANESRTKGVLGSFAVCSKQWGPFDSDTRAKWLKFHEKAKKHKEDVIRLEEHSWLKRWCYALLGKYRVE